MYADRFVVCLLGGCCWRTRRHVASLAREAVPLVAKHLEEVFELIDVKFVELCKESSGLGCLACQTGCYLLLALWICHEAHMDQEMVDLVSTEKGVLKHLERVSFSYFDHELGLIPVLVFFFNSNAQEGFRHFSLECVFMCFFLCSLYFFYSLNFDDFICSSLRLWKWQEWLYLQPCKISLFNSLLGGYP